MSLKLCTHHFRLCLCVGTGVSAGGLCLNKVPDFQKGLVEGVQRSLPLLLLLLLP